MFDLERLVWHGPNIKLGVSRKANRTEFLSGWGLKLGGASPSRRAADHQRPRENHCAAARRDGLAPPSFNRALLVVRTDKLPCVSPFPPLPCALFYESAGL